MLIGVLLYTYCSTVPVYTGTSLLRCYDTCIRFLGSTVVYTFVLCASTTQCDKRLLACIVVYKYLMYSSSMSRLLTLISSLSSV